MEHRSRIIDLGMDGRPLNYHHCKSPRWRGERNSRCCGKTLFCKEPSARTATSSGRRCVSKEPDRTQWSELGLRTADLY